MKLLTTNIVKEYFNLLFNQYERIIMGVFAWIVNGFNFALTIGSFSYKVARKLISLPFYKAKTTRGKIIMGGGSLAATGYFTEDQYDMIAHFTVDEHETRSFKKEMASWLAGDISLATAGSNYISGYGQAMLIHVSLTSIELLPVARMFKLGITNPTVLTASSKLRSSFMSKVDNISFESIQKIFKSKKYNKKDMDDLGIDMPAGQQKSFYDDIHNYFSKLKKGKGTTKDGKTARQTKDDKLSFKERFSAMSPGNKMAAGAGVTVFGVFVALWVQENEVGLTTVFPKIGHNIKRTYLLASTNYNRFFQNPLMSADITSFSQRHKVSTKDGFSAYIELQLLGKEVIETWYQIRDDAKPFFVGYMNHVLNDLVKLLDGKIENTGLVPQVVRLVLAAIKSNDIISFVKLITISVLENTITRKKSYDGFASEAVPIGELLAGFGSNKAINRILKSDDLIHETELIRRHVKGKNNSDNTSVEPEKTETKSETPKAAAANNVDNNNIFGNTNKNDIGSSATIVDDETNNGEKLSMNDDARNILNSISNEQIRKEGVS